MAKKKNMVKVDKARLYGELKKHGTTAAEASRAFGYGETYIANACFEGKINKTTMLLLERFYGISREAYEVVEKPVETEQPDEPTTGAQLWKMTRDELYQTICAAVYHAVKKAWSE